MKTRGKRRGRDTSELTRRPRSGSRAERDGPGATGGANLQVADQTIPPEAALLGKAVAAAFAASALASNSSVSRNDGVPPSDGHSGEAALFPPSSCPSIPPSPPRLFCAILLPNFSLQALLRHTPERRSLPIALIPDKTPRARITECTAAALAGGAEPGMTPTQAQARCNDLEIVLRSESAERSASAALLDCAGAFAPYVEDTAPGVATLELKTARLDPAPLAASIHSRLARLHLEPRLGFAPNPDLALLAAQSAQSASCCPQQETIPVREAPLPSGAAAPSGIQASSLCGRQASCLSTGSPSDEPHAGWEACGPHRQGCLCSTFAPPAWRQIHTAADLHALPLTSLPFPPPMLEILHRWGVTDLGGFVRLGRKNLAERLGPEILPLFAQATGAIDRPLKCLPPAQSYEEAVEFEHDIETLDPLLFMLRRLLEQIIVRLETTYLVAARLTLRLGFSHRAPYERTFKIPAPTAKVEVLFRALHTHLEQFTAEEPIISLTLHAEPCRPPRQQFGLFESALRDPNQFYETLARLAALLGNDRVGFPEVEDTHRPDSFHLRETAPEAVQTRSQKPEVGSGKPKSPSPASPKKPSNPSHNSRPPPPAPQKNPADPFQNFRNPETQSDPSDPSDAAGALRANGPTCDSPGHCEPKRASPGFSINEDPALKGRDLGAEQSGATDVPCEAPIVLKFPTTESTGVSASTSHCHPERSRRISNISLGEGGGEPLPSITNVTAFPNTPVIQPPTPEFQNSQNPALPLILRRFRPPLPVYVDLTPQRQPTAFTSAALRGQVAAAQGPVRISGEWWGDRAWSRLEWDLELTDGLLCRVYYDAVEQQWFLEGLYD